MKTRRSTCPLDAVHNAGSDVHLPHYANRNIRKSFHTKLFESPQHFSAELCYFFGLRYYSRSPLIFLNIKVPPCHGKSSSNTYISSLTVLLALILAATATAQTVTTKTVPPPAVPPKTIPMGEWNVVAPTQEFDGTVYHLHGHPAELEDGRMLFRANDIDWNQDTGDVHATGDVFFWNFDQNVKMWASRVDYNTDEETGKFYDVRGETQTKIVARPGVLTSNQPYYFEGQWAERIGEKYLLYHGWVTNCKLPNPWWRLRGPKFDIIPNDRAVSHNSIYVLRHFPLFYTPYFYHSLEKEPRKSGFLMPNLGHSSQRGEMVGLGYFWAINRSTDVTYRVQDFTARGFTHHIDFRTKPRQGSDFDLVLYGVQDRGVPGSGPPKTTYSGVSIFATGRSDLGNGWTAGGQMNYITSFRFRQEWTESFNEAIGSEIHSNGFVNKNWSTYTFDIVAARLENFESTEIQQTDPVTGNVKYLTNAVIIRKLPEAQFYSRDHALFPHLPIWYSLESTAGLLYRSAPVFDSNNKLIDEYETGSFMNRVNLAPHITTAIHWGEWLHIVPSFGIHETYYGESQTLNSQGYFSVVGTNRVRSARDLSVDFVFPSLYRVYNKKTVFGDKLKHVIEPRATYRYVTGIGSSFNDFIRFDDTDLLSNTNELELSLTNRIYAKRGNQVQEIFTWEIAQKRYFDPTFGGALIDGQRNIFASTADLTAYAFLVGPRSTSPVASTIRMSPITGLGIQWLADYDPRYHAIVDSSFSVDYRWQRYFVSAGNNEVHDNTLLSPFANQYRFRVGFGDANRRGWNAAVDAVYDYRQQVIQYSTTQVTYNTDCCGLSFQYRRYNIGIRDETQYRIAFSIANLGSFGTLRKQDRLF
jgi:LPS-assembly protein